MRLALRDAAAVDAGNCTSPTAVAGEVVRRTDIRGLEAATAVVVVDLGGTTEDAFLQDIGLWSIRSDGRLGMVAVGVGKL